ncbi:MAG TPA: hypothetical protein VF759_01210 [Allosphingosinicella sp.]|jgi:hypothetical protein
MIRALLAAVLMLTPFAAAQAQPGVNATAPAPQGSAQRRAILNALRPAVERRLGPNVEFVVSSIRIRPGWAVVMADPQRRGGGRIDGRRYFPASDWEFMDGITVTAVLRFASARWSLVNHAIGATDVWYCDGETMPPGIARAFGC